MALKRCNQCWRELPLEQFVGVRKAEVQDCADCREGRPAADEQRRSLTRRRRRGLVGAPSDRWLWTRSSNGKKLRGIPSVIAAAGTCPPSCAFWGRGCYAEAGHLGSHWTRTSALGLTLLELAEKIAALPRGQLWRYAVAGDLPGAGEDIDIPALMLIAFVNHQAGARGFTFTHKPMASGYVREKVRRANFLRGFTINLSADSPAHADELEEQMVGPVVTTLPKDWKGGTTPAGRRIVECPADTHGLTCERCRLCAKPFRKSVVAFRAHGQGAAIVSKLVSIDQLRRSA